MLLSVRNPFTSTYIANITYLSFEIYGYAKNTQRQTLTFETCNTYTARCGIRRVAT